MGMYTAFHIGVEIKKDTPEKVLQILKMMADKENVMNEADFDNDLPDHPFFHCDRWKYLFKMDSYYFSYQTHWDFRYDTISSSYFLSVTSNLKNYDGEIDKFIDWIKPYIDENEGEMIGYKRYEEDDEPTIFYA